jgi:hypothetical protein
MPLWFGGEASWRASIEGTQPHSEAVQTRIRRRCVIGIRFIERERR